MTFSTMLDRTVTITPRVVDGRDDRGNDVVVDGEPFTVWAMRDLTDRTEDENERDQQGRTYRYLLEARTDDGATIPVTGWDRLVDSPGTGNEETFEIIGTPEYARQRRRGRIHHVEVIARRFGPSGAGVLP